MLTRPDVVWDYSLEDSFSFKEDRFQGRKVVVRCTHCRRKNMPFLSKKMKTIESGWRWVGVSHKEPYAVHEHTCRCGKTYKFGTHVPQ